VLNVSYGPGEAGLLSNVSARTKIRCGLASLLLHLHMQMCLGFPFQPMSYEF
jgi:hypothetical protein